MSNVNGDVNGVIACWAASAGVPFKSPHLNSEFQELNEQAKKAQEGGLGDLDSLLADMDPNDLEMLAGLGDQLDEVMQMMASMSPEELEKQMNMK